MSEINMKYKKGLVEQTVSAIEENIRNLLLNKVNEYDSLLAAFSASKCDHADAVRTQLQAEKEAVNSLAAFYQKTLITDSFEGVSAQQLSLDVPQTVEVMDRAAGQISAVLPGIADQIKKIEDYIAELEVEKQGLQDQIDTLLGEL